MARYAAQYGEGWLWYEPPLAAREPHLLAATVATTNPYMNDAWPTATYHLVMGFQAVKSLVLAGERKKRGEDIGEWKGLTDQQWMTKILQNPSSKCIPFPSAAAKRISQS